MSGEGEREGASWNRGCVTNRNLFLEVEGEVTAAGRRRRAGAVETARGFGSTAEDGEGERKEIELDEGMRKEREERRERLEAHGQQIQGSEAQTAHTRTNAYTRSPAHTQQGPASWEIEIAAALCDRGGKRAIKKNSPERRKRGRLLHFLCPSLHRRDTCTSAHTHTHTHD